MLTGSNNSALSYKKINSEFMFFYQRWQELLEGRTLDMYQYNILNSCVACLELSEVIDKTLEGLLTSRQNVDDVKLETLEIIKQDDILQRYNRTLYTTLLRIVSTKIESKQRDELVEDKGSLFFSSLKRLKYQLQTPLRILVDNYLQYVIQELKKNFVDQDEALIDKHASVLASQCINNGWSAKGLFKLVECLEGDASLDAKWQLFVRRISLDSLISFEIYYGITIETRPGLNPAVVRGIIQDLGLDIKKGEDIIDADVNRHNLYTKLDSSKYYIVVCLQATDLHSATLSAINLLNRKLSVATFYNVIDPWIARAPQIVAYCVQTKGAESLKITDVFKTYDYVDSTNNVFEDTKAILVSPEKSQMMNRLHAAFSYTNLSRSSFFQETKYISLWIAIESVMRTGQYSDIISHVKCVLPEILSVRYLYRIVRNFSEDCIRCGYKNDLALFLNMETINKKQLVTLLIAIFRDDQRYTVLFQSCQTNKLLAYRCNEIRKIVNDIPYLLAKLDHYTVKIRWHIQRLYRIRNEITHSAFQRDKSLTIYIEHLYAYLSQLICEVVYYIEHKGVTSIEEAFSTIIENHKTFIELLKEGHVSGSDVLPDGIIDVFG